MWKTVLQHSLKNTYQCGLKRAPRRQNNCYPALYSAEILQNKGLHRGIGVHSGVRWFSLFETIILTYHTRGIMNIHGTLSPLVKRYYCCVIISPAVPRSKNGAADHSNNQPYKALPSPIREWHISFHRAPLF